MTLVLVFVTGFFQLTKTFNDLYSLIWFDLFITKQHAYCLPYNTSFPLWVVP